MLCGGQCAAQPVSLSRFRDLVVLGEKLVQRLHSTSTLSTTVSSVCVCVRARACVRLTCDITCKNWSISNTFTCIAIVNARNGNLPAKTRGTGLHCVQIIRRGHDCASVRECVRSVRTFAHE